MAKKKKRQRSDEVAVFSGDDSMSSPTPKGVDKTPNNNSDDMNSNTNYTPPNNDDPSTWSKSKRKRMRQKRNKAAKKLALSSSGDNNSTDNNGVKQASNIINSPSKQTASAMQKMNMNSPNHSTKTSIAHSNDSDQDSSKKRHKKNPEDKSITHESEKLADKSISDHTVVSNEDSRSPKREEKQMNDTACSPTSNTHIDGEDTPTKKKRKKKKKKKKSPVKEGTSSTTNDKEDVASSNSKPNSNKKQTTNNKKTTTNNNTATQKPASPKLKISLPKQSQMSTLQKSFLERLTSSRFRELNEELYTHSSQHSFDYFTANPELFDQYHVGFRKQVEDWPVNPVDVIYKKILSSWRKDRGDMKKSKDSQEEEQQTVVADFGCGDAKLGKRLLSLQIGKDGQSLTPSVSSKKKKKQNQQQQASICPFKVHSFDLVSGGNKLVTPADMANLPLQKECIDVGVYSLALMGTNVADFVREAWRVLKFNGVLRVAEVRSRFETAAAEDNDINNHGGGGGKRGKLNNGKKSLLKKKNSKPTHSSSGGDDNEYNTPQPIMLLDEFLALMERCGFECTNMDRSNKMFLFMDFVKVDGSKGLSEKERFTAKPCIYKRR